MRSGGGKDKGSGFERDVCRDLSLWISNGVRKDVFWRSSSSGGRATVAAAKGQAVEYAASDIAPVHPLAYALLDLFAIECKFYADLHLQDLPWPERVSNISEFWKQARRDAASADRWPMLVAKQNHKPVLMGLQPEVLAIINQVQPLRIHHLLSSGLDLVLLDFKAVLSQLPPEKLPELIRYRTCKTS